MIRETPGLVFGDKMFYVAGNDFYIEHEKIGDYAMTCCAILRAKENGSLAFNGVNYEVKNNILYINGTEMGDHELIVHAIERAKTLTDELAPRRCDGRFYNGDSCNGEGPFRLSSKLARK